MSGVYIVHYVLMRLCDDSRAHAWVELLTGNTQVAAGMLAVGHAAVDAISVSEEGAAMPLTQLCVLLLLGFHHQEAARCWTQVPVRDCS